MFMTIAEFVYITHVLCVACLGDSIGDDSKCLSSHFIENVYKTSIRKKSELSFSIYLWMLELSKMPCYSYAQCSRKSHNENSLKISLFASRCTN